MDEKDQFLVQRLGLRNKRSRALRPHIRLIAELRGRGFRYADIAAWLTEHENVRVTASAVAKHCQREATASRNAATSTLATAPVSPSYAQQTHQQAPQSDHEQLVGSPNALLVPDRAASTYADDWQLLSLNSRTDAPLASADGSLPTSVASSLGTAQVRPMDRYTSSLDEALDITDPEFIAARQAIRRGQ